MTDRIASSTISRRSFLCRATLLTATGLLAACAPAAPPAAPAKSAATPAPPAAPATPAAPVTGAAATAAPAAKAPAAPAGGAAALVIAQDADAVTMDPMMTHTGTTFVILENLYDTLVRWGPDGRLAPALAEAWKQVDDKTYDFTLRRGVKFHNGEELSAEAVKYSFDRVFNPDIVSPATAYFKRAGIQTAVVSPDTIRLSTAVPYSAFLASLVQAYAVPPKYVEQVGKEGFAQKPVGTGPYKFVEWVKDQRVVLERNDDYWGGKPRIERVTFRPIPEPSARLAALTTGEIDLAVNVPLDRYADVEQGRDTKLIVRDGNLLYLGMQQLAPPFNDKRVRQAVNHAVDVDAIIKGLMKNQVTRLPSAFYRETPGFDASLQPYPYDLARARTLLAEAGHPNGFETELYVAPNLGGTSKLKELAEVTAEQLKQVGITARINTLDIAAFNQRLPRGEYPMYFYVWTSDPASGRFLETLFSSKARGWYYKDPTVDGLVDQYFATIDEKEREAVGRRLNQFLYDDAPWQFLFQYKSAYGAKKSVSWEAKPSFDSMIRVADISKA